MTSSQVMLNGMMNRQGQGAQAAKARPNQQPMIGSRGGLTMEPEAQNYDALLHQMAQGGGQQNVKNAVLGTPQLSGMGQGYSQDSLGPLRPKPQGVPPQMMSGVGAFGQQNQFVKPGAANAGSNLFGGGQPQNQTQPAGLPASWEGPMPGAGNPLSQLINPQPMLPMSGAAGGGLPGQDQRDQLRWGNVGRMSGFEVNSDYGGDLKARNSMKNTFGRLASNFESSPDGVRQLVQTPEFQQMFPNARLIDHPTDPKIDFGGMLSDYESGVPVGVVDVLAKSGQEGWQWLDEANDGGGGGGQQFMPANTLYDQFTQSILQPQDSGENELYALLAQLQQEQAQQPEFDPQAILAGFQGF
jgi:hypothetical protein